MSAEDAYVQLPFEVSPSQLEDNAVAVLEGKWPDWTADDADMAVVLFEANSPAAVNLARLLAEMPPAALIAFGTKMLELPYGEGVAATGTVKFTTTTKEGIKRIPAGSELDIDGVAFQTVEELVIGEGVDEGTVGVRANVVGTVGNGLTGAAVAGVTLPAFVTPTGITVLAPTANGEDQETATEYLNKVSEEMRLRSKSIITLVDFEIAAVSQQGIGGACALGQPGKPRNIDVYLKSPEGAPVGSTVREALEAEYAKTRMANAIVQVLSAEYDTIGATWTALGLAGASPASVEAASNAALEIALSPAKWGKPTSAQPGLSWVNNPVVHVNKLIQVLSSIAGIDYLESLQLRGSNVAMLSRTYIHASSVKLHVCSLASQSLGTLESALGTGGAITSLPTNPLALAIPTGETIELNDGAGHTQAWTTAAAAAVGATSVSVTSQVPSFAFPANTTKLEGPSVLLANKPVLGETYTLTDPTGLKVIELTIASEPSPGLWEVAGEVVLEPETFPIASVLSGPVLGDLTMPGAVALPEPGTITGTVNSPAE